MLAAGLQTRRCPEPDSDIATIFSMIYGIETTATILIGKGFNGGKYYTVFTSIKDTTAWYMSDIIGIFAFLGSGVNI